MATAVMAVTLDRNIWPQTQHSDETPPSPVPAYPVSLRLNEVPPPKVPVQTRSPALRPQVISMSPGDRFPSIVSPDRLETVDTRPPRIARLPPQEPEVCIECAMRDEEMADVDVSSPGVWDRESDVWFDELVRKEREDELAGIAPVASRPRAKGQSLTESNLKLWLSMNPKEAAARDNTVRTYVHAQIQLLDAENLARSQAEKESQVLTEQMRHTYSNLRRSAYELSSPVVGEDGVRIRAPRSASGSGFADLMTNGDDQKRRGNQTTLLENGMIVEKLDLKQEERARRKREKSRQRTSSRTSVRESVPHAPSMRSVASVSSARPVSMAPSTITTSQPRRAILPSVRSQASGISQTSTEASMHRGSKSPRFFNFKNWSGAMSTRSSVRSAAISGSMIDMHIGLEQDRFYPIPPLPSPPITNKGAIDLSSIAPSTPDTEPWLPPEAIEPIQKPPSVTSTTVPRKTSKMGKLLRIFGASKGSRRSAAPSTRSSRSGINGVSTEEEAASPLAPPPPISVLVDRRAPSLTYSQGRNAQSTMSLSSSSPRNGGLSPMTTGSSAFSSPSFQNFRDNTSEFGGRTQVNNDYELQPPFIPEARPLQRIASESDMRSPPSKTRGGHPTPPLSRVHSSWLPAGPTSPLSTRPVSYAVLDKDLPPLPSEAGEQSSHTGTVTGNRLSQSPMPMSQTPFPLFDTYPDRRLDKRNTLVTAEVLEPPRFPADNRRQSFGGMASRPEVTRGVDYGDDASYRYAEFGMSRRSLNVQAAERHYYMHPSHILCSDAPLPNGDSQEKPTSAKRRSRFFSSFLGRKSQDKARSGPETQAASFVPDTTYHSRSADANLQKGSRISLASRNPTSQLLDPEQDFVAYRYPSAHEELGLPL